MYYSTIMQSNFEAEKNQKASAYTAVICGALLLISWVITWPETPPPPPIVEDLIEVNLGNDNEGFGEVQPLIKGDMAPAQQPAHQNNVASAPANEEPAKDINTDDKPDADAAAVTKIEKNNSKKNEAPKENITKPVKTKTPAPVTTPAPAKPQKHKATYGGVQGNGNGATEDNGYTSQGNKPGGKGDAGSPNGKPDSYGNNPGGRSGVSVVKGARPLNFGSVRLEDDFNENAKVYLDVKYNSSGGFISSYVAKGTTTTNGTILSIARREAAKLKFPAAPDGGLTRILFNFKIQN